MMKTAHATMPGAVRYPVSTLEGMQPGPLIPRVPYLFRPGLTRVAGTLKSDTAGESRVLTPRLYAYALMQVRLNRTRQTLAYGARHGQTVRGIIMPTNQNNG